MEEKTAQEWVDLGIENGENGNFAEAIVCFENAVDLDEDNIDAHYNLGVIFGKIYLEDRINEDYLEDYAEEEALLARAEIEYHRVLELDPENEEAQNNLKILTEASENKLLEDEEQ